MNKKILFFLLAIVVIAGGVWLYDWVLGDTMDASEPISAIPLEIETGTSNQVVGAGQAQTTEPAFNLSTPEAVGSGSKSEIKTLPAQGLNRYVILQEESQARFTIFEELNGVPNDVIGITDQIAGEAAINLEDLSQTRLGVILVNARTLATDQDRRNQAIRNRILQTDQYEYVTFTPTEIRGLNGSAEAGQTFSFSIIGDLTIQDITRSVEFETSVLVESPERLTGSATTVIAKSDFRLIVPNVPFVANVGEDVTLVVEFVLSPASP